MDAKAGILIVDDNLGNRIAFGSTLETLGQKVVAVESGREALEQCLYADFAVILLDVRMPDMDGLEVATVLRQREQTRLTPILFVSAFEATPTLVSDLRLVGAMDYLFSPVDPELLRLKVAAFLDLESERQRKRQSFEAVVLENEALRRTVALLQKKTDELRQQLDLCSS